MLYRLSSKSASSSLSLFRFVSFVIKISLCHLSFRKPLSLFPEPVLLHAALYHIQDLLGTIQCLDCVLPVPRPFAGAGMSARRLLLSMQRWYSMSSSKAADLVA